MSLCCVDPDIGATTTVFGTAYTECSAVFGLIFFLDPDGAVTSISNTSGPVFSSSVICVTWTLCAIDEYSYDATAPGTSDAPTNTFTAPVAATSATFVVSVSQSSIVSVTDEYLAPAANPRTSWSSPLVAPFSDITALTPLGHAYTPLAVASVALSVRDTPAHVTTTYPVTLMLALGVNASATDASPVAALAVPVVCASWPDPTLALHAVPSTSGVLNVAVTVFCTSTVMCCVAVYSTLVGNLYAPSANSTRARVVASTSVTATLVVGPVYVAPIVNTETSPFGSVPNTTFGPTIESTTHAASSVSGTCVVSPSTHEYTDPASVPAVHVFGATTTSIASLVSVVAYPSGALNTTENCNDPAYAGVVYGPTATVCVAASYAYDDTEPSVAEPKGPTSQDTAPVASTDPVFAVVGIDKTIELVFPVPHTPPVVPYVDPAASLVIDASKGPVVGPANETARPRLVGIAYTFAASIGVAVYGCETDPSVSVSVTSMSCFAVGTIVYVAPVPVTVAPDVATHVSVAPDGIVVVPKLHSSFDSRPNVSTEPLRGPLLVATHCAVAGSVYIAPAATIATTTVRVLSNISVIVVSAALAVIVASSTLALANEPSATTVVGGDTECTDGTASAARFPFTVALVCENTNCALVALPATRDTPSVIGSRRTVSGTAYTTCVSALEKISFFWPDGAVTSTPKFIAPVCAPSVIDVTVTSCFSASYT